MEPAQASEPSRAPLFVGLLLIAVMTTFCAMRLKVTTEITHFFATGDDPHRAQLARALAESELTRALVLTLEADTPGDAEADLDLAARAGAALEAALKDDPAVEWVRGGSTPDFERAVFDVYFPRRLALLATAKDGDVAARLTDEGLREAARELKRQLTLPTAPLVKKLAPDDPLLAFVGILDRLERAGQGALRVHGGRFVTPDGRAAVLFVATRGSPFDTTKTAPFLERLGAHVTRIGSELGRPLRVERSGVHPFAVTAEKSIKADVTRISIYSSVAVTLLFLLMFRSLRVTLLAAVPLVCGLVAGTTVVLLVYGQLHGLTLAFGVTLIGVVDDYPIHLLTHHTLLRSPGGASASLRAVWPGLRLGALTTLIGFGALAYTSFPGLREVALFTAVGVIAALAATRWLMPPLLPRDATPTSAQVLAGRAGGRLLATLRARPLLAVAPALVAVAIAAIGLPRVKWTDDVAALQRMDEGLLAEEARVRERAARVDGARMVIARARTIDDALALGEAAAARLDGVVEAGGLRAFKSVRDLVPSRAVQERTLAQLRADPTLPDRLLAALAAEGFRPATFAPAADALRALPAPLALAELEESPLADLVRPFHAGLGDKEAVLLYLVGADVPKLEAALAGLEGVDVFDQRAWLTRAYGEYRTRTISAVALGTVGIVLLLFARHRRAAPMAAAVGPALLATAATLAIFGLFGAEVHLLHLVSLLLVLSMGVDYGVFLCEEHESDAEVEATLLAIWLSCSTTVLSFGMLALSTSPALRAIGLTVGTGVLLSLLLAPVALVLARVHPPAKPPAEG